MSKKITLAELNEQVELINNLSNRNKVITKQIKTITQQFTNESKALKLKISLLKDIGVQNMLRTLILKELNGKELLFDSANFCFNIDSKSLNKFKKYKTIAEAIGLSLSKNCIITFYIRNSKIRTSFWGYKEIFNELKSFGLKFSESEINEYYAQNQIYLGKLQENVSKQYLIDLFKE